MIMIMKIIHIKTCEIQTNPCYREINGHQIRRKHKNQISKTFFAKAAKSMKRKWEESLCCTPETNTMLCSINQLYSSFLKNWCLEYSCLDIR